MDPNATLAEIRALTAIWEGNGELDASDGEQLAELIVALDGWLTTGGFLPSAWSVAK